MQAAPVGGRVQAAGGPQGSAPRKGSTILCVGDSLTAGVRLKNDSYPLHLEKFLGRAGHRFKVDNAGVWGLQCDAILGILQGSITAALKHDGFLAFSLVLAGTNDIMAFSEAPVILEKLGRIHATLARAPGSPCIGVCTLPPCGTFKPVQEQTRLEVNEGLRQLCQQHGNRTRFLIDLEDVSLSLSHDGIHYQGDGHVEFAQRALDALRPQLGVLPFGRPMPAVAAASASATAAATACAPVVARAPVAAPVTPTAAAAPVLAALPAAAPPALVTA